MQQLMLVVIAALAALRDVSCDPVTHNEHTPYINEVFLSTEDVESDNVQSFIELYLPTVESDQDVYLLTSFYGIFFIEDGPPARIIEFLDLRRLILSAREVTNYKYFVICTQDFVSNCAAKTPVLPFGLQQTSLILVRKPALEQSGSLGLEKINGFYVMPRTILFDTTQQQLLESLAVDAVGVVNNADMLGQPFMQTIISAFIGSPKVLPVDSDAVLNTFSLSRCSDTRMTSSSFLYSPKTPGLPNVCSGIEQDWFDDIMDSDNTNPPGTPTVGPTIPTGSPFAEDAFRIPNCMQHFTESMVSTNLFDYLTEPDKLERVSFILNTENPPKSTLRCESCFYFLEQHPTAIKSTRQTNLMKAGGLEFGSLPKYTKKTLKHHFTGVHVEILDMMEKMKCDGATSVEAKDHCIDLTSENLRKIIGLVYLEAKLGYSFLSHKGLTHGLTVLGLDVGNQYLSESSAKRITKHIAKYVHIDWINNLIAEQSPFSIMLDSSTDVGGKHGLLVYFMHLEKGQVVVRLWRYVEATDSSAKGLADLVISMVESETHPEFKAYFKERIVSFATDGASNMLCAGTSLTARLEQYVSDKRGQRPIEKYHCSNHKLALAYNDVIYSRKDELKFCKKMVDHCNKVASFYSTRSYRRLLELEDESKESSTSVLRYKKIQRVRWVSAAQESYAVVDYNYEIMMRHLSRIVSPEHAREYTAATKNEATAIKTIFIDRNFLATMSHHRDIITIFSVWSKVMESKTSNIMDIEEWRIQVTQTLQTLLIVPGTFLARFYKECLCDGAECTADTFEQSVEVVFREVELSSGGSGVPPLSDTQDDVIHELLAALERRFPETAASAFSILNPPVFRTSKMDDFVKLAEYLERYHGISRDVAVDFFNLQQTLIAMGAFDGEGKYLKPTEFWEVNLDKMPKNERLREAIKVALVQPSSTARVEAGFSLTNAIKSQARNRLRIETVEMLLRITQNGPNIEDFPANDYAKTWLLDRPE